MSKQFENLKQAIQEAQEMKKNGYSLDADTFMEIIQSEPNTLQAFLNMFNVGFMLGAQSEKAKQANKKTDA